MFELLLVHAISVAWPVAGAKSAKSLTYTAFGAACSEVEINLLTGEKTILRSDLYFDCGRSLNPAVDIGQVCTALHLLMLPALRCVAVVC